METSRPPLELWGGVECTVNRVGDRYFDQLAFSGHDRRRGDLERIAGLGIRTLRYPVLWERTAPHDPGCCDWSWPDERLGLLKSLGVRPIVGLLHHGSGPAYTGHFEPGFAEGLADFAGRVAERYPWIDAYTPVNEPLTTARFSALYGHWYPHARSDLAFARSLLAQCRAVVLAMRAVRRVRPDARLVQTEDLGKAHSTAALRYQADFENERRWLTFDLLCGRVDRRHPVGSYLSHVGVREEELAWFLDNPCPPDLIGVNHYLTSERFLDERVERYPIACRGGNGRHVYADVEMVRVGEPDGPEELLRQAWRRLRVPLAVTEAHLGCTREEQMRWLAEVWGGAVRLRGEGVDLRAVTAWALLGTYDWDSLVTLPRGHYEPGAFDARDGTPRPTALAHLVRGLASGGGADHAALDAPGWWRRPERVCYPWVGRAPAPVPPRPRRELLIAGAAGALGRAFARVCAARGLACRLVSRPEMDIADLGSVEASLEGVRPWAVVNAAGYVRVDEAEREPDLCRRSNVTGPAVLARACARRGLPLVTFSSDLVFDGRRGSPYRESDEANPLGAYGRSKAEGEAEVRRLHPGALILRSSAFFGPWDETNFVTAALGRLAGGSAFAAAEDVTVSPTYLPDLANACLDLLLDGEHGVWHLANQGAVSWFGLAQAAAEAAGLDPSLAQGRPAASFGWHAPRPAYSALGSERGLLLPHWQDALDRYLRARPGHSPGPRRGAARATQASLC